MYINSWIWNRWIWKINHYVTLRPAAKVFVNKPQWMIQPSTVRGFSALRGNHQSVMVLHRWACLMLGIFLGECSKKKRGTTTNRPVLSATAQRALHIRRICMPNWNWAHFQHKIKVFEPGVIKDNELENFISVLNMCEAYYVLCHIKSFSGLVLMCTADK